MFIFKILIWVTLLWIILSSSFFQKILSWMSWAITNINSNFWAYLPADIRVFFSLLVLALLFGLVYAFKK